MEFGSESFKDLCLQICGGLSTVGCVLIILSGIFYKKLRSFTFRLIIYLSIADLFASICFLLPDDEDTSCVIQAITMNYSQLTSILLTGVIAYSLFLMIVKENLNVAGMECKFLLFAFGVPAILTPLPYFTRSYGPSKGWCWIKDAGVVNQSWMFTEFYGPFLLIFMLNIYFYSRIYYKINYESHETFETRIMQKLMKKLKIYPISLILCFGVAFIHRVYYLAGFQENYDLDLISGCLLSLYGFINAVVYGFTRSVRKSIKRTFNNLLSASDNSCSSKLIES